MVKSTQTSFPLEGVELHVSAQDARAQGIQPGEPAVVEVTLRSPTPEEWIAQGNERGFGTEDEGAEAAPAVAVAVAAPGAVAPEGGEAADGRPTIRWRPARAAG